MSEVNHNVTCLCGCRRIRKTRGLAGPCYQRVLQAVKDGKTTMAAEETAGRILKARRGFPIWDGNWRK